MRRQDSPNEVACQFCHAGYFCSICEQELDHNFLGRILSHLKEFEIYDLEYFIQNAKSHALETADLFGVKYSVTKDFTELNAMAGLIPRWIELLEKLTKEKQKRSECN